MQPILIVVPQSNELQPLLSGLDRLGHPSQPIVIGNTSCYSIRSLGATAAVGGHGKTQFAVQCQYLIDRCDGLAAIFCVGAAGSLSPDVHFGDVVVGECTIEHDYKIRFEPAEPPCHAANESLLDEVREAAIGPLPFRTHFGPIASGDEDIVDEVRARELQHFTGAKCVAWEGSGGARAAAFNGVPFLEIRSITDGADADAAASFRANCECVLPNIAELLVRWRLISKVLEVGCGTGNYISAIAASVGCCCWGADPSEQMLRQAAGQSRRVHFQVGRAEQIEFPDRSFDRVFSVDVIHHVQDRAAFFREARRVLQDGGEVWTVTDSEEIIRRRHPLATYFPETIDVDLARYPSNTELRRLMEQAGFQQVEEVEVHFPKPCADISAYREKAFSCLHLIPEEAHRRGIQRLEQDLQSGPLIGTSSYLMLSGVRP